MEISNSVKMRGKRKTEFIAFLIVLIVALTMSNSAFATGADVTITGVNKFGSPVNNPYIELYLGNIKPFSAADPYVNASAAKQDEKSWNFSNGNYGYGIGAGDNQLVYGRVWAEGNRGVNNHYGLAADYTSGPGDNAKSIIWAIDANYRAAQPFDPFILKFTYSAITAYDAQGHKTSSSQLTVDWAQKLPGTGENAEVTSVRWHYGKGGAMIDIEVPNDSSNNYGNLVLNDPAQGTYSFQAALVNSWGVTGPSTQLDYDVSGGAGLQSFTLILESAAPTGPGINFFSMPFAAPWYVGIKEIKTAYDLVVEINSAAGPNVVSTFGRWDKTATVQDDVGVLILDNDPDSIKVEPGQTQDVTTRLKGLFLEQGEGYQVYIAGIAKVELVIKNTP